MYGEIRFPAVHGRAAFKVRRISEITIDSSWKSLTDSATIILPRRVRDFDRDNITKVFNEGDPVQVWFGYNGNLELEFEGYLTKIPVGIPLTFSCENEMYKLKRTEVSVSMQNCTLKKLLQTIAEGYEVVCDETKLLGTIRYPKQTASQILDDLKKTGINCWFEGKVLHAFSTSKSDKEPVSVLLERTAGDSLKQKAVEATMVVISLLRKIGKKINVEFGDKGAGKRIRRELSGITMSETEMMNEAKAIYANAKMPGLDGDITLFGIPRVVHGMKMKLRSVYYPEKNGIYYIDAVTKKYNRQGIRQQCKLGDKAI